MECQKFEVDGVPLFWVEDPGPMHAGLIFRVGRADEPAARSGITHLVEHLALHGIGVGDPHINGSTSSLFTTFLVHGGEDEAARFLADVTVALGDLPLDRLETERAILRTEANGRSWGVREALACWRYGPATFGIPAFEEFGLHCVTADEVRAWVTRWFTRENAAVWVAGKRIPPGLRLDLRSGEPMPIPKAVEVLPRTPAYFNGAIKGVAVDGIVDNSAAAALFSDVFERRMHARLRRELGISYQTSAVFETRDADHATITLYADALPEKHGELVGPLIDLLTGFDRMDDLDGDLEAVRADAIQAIEDPRNAVALAVREAMSALGGGRREAGLIERVKAVTVDDLREVARQVHHTALAMLPPGQAIGRAGFSPAPPGSTERVVGREYRSADGDPQCVLVVGDQGISAVTGLDLATVFYHECVALLTYPDGARTLLGEDAVRIHIEPNLWKLASGTIARIDSAFAESPEKVVPMPERPADEIPEVPTKSSNSAVQEGRTRPGWNQVQGITIALLTVAFIVLVAAGQLQGAMVPFLIGVVIAIRAERRKGRQL